MHTSSSDAILRFGVTVHAAGSAAEFRGSVEAAVRFGYDVIAAPDHLGAIAPFTGLAAAAAIAPTVRLRTYVLNTGFWNPALLAREAATLDLLSGGRVELGLGAGYAANEFKGAGLPWRRFGDRVEHLADTLERVRVFLGDENCQPRPVQAPLPIMIGGSSYAALDLARTHADIVGFSGLVQVAGAPPGTFTLMTSAQALDRARFVAEVTRPVRTPDLLLQIVAIGPSPRSSADAVASSSVNLTAKQVLDSPFALLASTPEEAAAELVGRSRLYGLGSVTVLQHNLASFGRVVAAYRANCGRPAGDSGLDR